MPTKDELQLDNERLRDENARLRAQLGSTARPAPAEPSFGVCEGTRQDIKLAKDRVAAGETTRVEVSSPFTGKVIETVSQSDTGLE